MSFAGQSSQKIVISAGAGVAAVGNRGLGNEGLYIEANKEYDGFFFAKSSKPVSLVARMINKHTNASIGGVTIPFAGIKTPNFSLYTYILNSRGMHIYTWSRLQNHTVVDLMNSRG